MQLVNDVCRSFSIKRYMPLCFDGIYGFPNVIPNDNRKNFPKFSGNHPDLVSHHIQVFSDLIGDYEISHEDVHMELFSQSFEGDTRD